jgi:hypothetical protein
MMWSHQLTLSFGHLISNKHTTRQETGIILWLGFFAWNIDNFYITRWWYRRKCKQTVHSKGTLHDEKSEQHVFWCSWPNLYLPFYTLSVSSARTIKQTDTRSHLFTIAVRPTHALYSTPSWMNRLLRPQLQCNTWFWQDNHLPSSWNPPAKWTCSIPRYECSSQTGTGLRFPNETCQEYMVIVKIWSPVKLANNSLR